MKKLAITCDAERGILLSNERDEISWQALDHLIILLKNRSLVDSFEVLFHWKEKGHLATAKEPYAWREAIDQIKNNDLREICSEVENVPLRNLMSDRPVMLKIAGEVTNSLLHSYTLRHRINFAQIFSNVPS